MGIQWKDGYSAEVDLYLIVEGQRIDLAQVGPSHFVLSQPNSIAPATECTLVVSVDGREKRYDVVVPHGATDSLEPVAYF